ncbi:ATP-binding cassette domain-containing protein [Paenibacillus sp. YAF4_2]|uniref:ATP-binding cassette domain-containing protein n=1 Tax=Paenibacillus sp. YAF4_2 TaxID=3233085 RepID=UPI003F963672
MVDDWKLSQATVIAQSERGKELLSGINLTFRSGAITLLVGHNGSGKSTLLETLAGLRRLHSGSIEQGNESLWTNDGRKPRLNKSIVMNTGIALQQSESQWFASTVREEFDYSLKPYGITAEEREKRIVSAMEQAGLPLELLARDPWTLSGGQQRRLAIACLMACEPQWLLLDEPTAGLDADGIRRLCAMLDAHRAAGRGAVVATHDLDALLPLADEVAVISGGSVREAAPAASWAVTHAHAAAAPQAQRALAQLRAAGFAPPAEPGGAPWPAPRELAALLAAQRAATPVQAAAAQTAAACTTTIEPPSIPAAPTTTTTLTQPNRLASRFDPRALIAAYLLLATTILLQHSWAGLAVAAALSAAALIPLREQIRPWMKAIRAYIIMIAIIAIFAGLHLNPVSFDWAPAMQNIQRFSGLLLVMLLGLPLMALVTPLRVQRSLEQTFGWLNQFKVPVTQVALTVTLIFRFIPLLADEWERYVKIAHARGKATTASGSLPFRMLLPAMVPYIRSLLRMAEQMADALEARGIGHPAAKPTQGLRLRFSREDILIVIFAATAAAILILIR